MVLTKGILQYRLCFGLHCAAKNFNKIVVCLLLNALLEIVKGANLSFKTCHCSMFEFVSLA